jgi:hypothetical protein
MATRVRRKEENLRIAQDFECFNKSGQLLSSRYERMIEKYPKQWIAVYDGKVKASGSSIEVVLSEIDRKSISRELILLRFITDEPKSMIL